MSNYDVPFEVRRRIAIKQKLNATLHHFNDALSLIWTARRKRDDHTQLTQETSLSSKLRTADTGGILISTRIVKIRNWSEAYSLENEIGKTKLQRKLTLFSPLGQGRSPREREEDVSGNFVVDEASILEAE